jgi:hypothetical protein
MAYNMCGPNTPCPHIYTIKMVRLQRFCVGWFSPAPPLLTGGRRSEVIYVIKVPNGTTKGWSLQAGGRDSEVVVGSDLTVTRDTWGRKVTKKCHIFFEWLFS